MEVSTLIVVQALYFMLPAYVSNAAPVVAARLDVFKSLAFPLDGNKKLNGESLFGESKTARGFFVGITSAIIVALIQYFIYIGTTNHSIYLIDYNLFNSILIGFLLGTGALIGDLIKSFLKRRIGKKSGQSWPIADQIDYPLGALFFVSTIFIPSASHIITIIILSMMLSALANLCAYFLGIKKVWW
jgi:CDP-2,3-bis-(O-geranylgeranyl)-sn-glycerol synthase